MALLPLAAMAAVGGASPGVLLQRYGHSTFASHPPPALPRDSVRDGTITVTTRNGTVLDDVVLDGRKTAMVVIDMWSFHWCKTLCNRAGALVPRLNAVAAAVRAVGGTVVWSPTDAAGAYAGTPQRERVLALPRPTPVTLPNRTLPDLNFKPSGHQDECSDSGGGCLYNSGQARMNPGLVIHESDYIVGSEYDPTDAYAVLKHLGIETVIVAGIAENVCVQAKSASIPRLWALGFNTLLARDLTDAESHYDPETWRDGLPWAHPDWGSFNATAAIESQGIAKTIEAGTFALWPAVPTEPVMHAPWGSTMRPHLYDTYTVVTLSTWCNAGASVGCGKPYAIRFTLDGSAPTASSMPFTKPFNVSAAPGQATMVRAAGFALSDGSPVFAESQSVLVRRGFSLRDGEAPPATLPIDLAPRLWGRGDDHFYRMYPMLNRSWMELPLLMRSKTYERGLGLKPPGYLTYNVSDVRAAAPAPITTLSLAVGLDEACMTGPGAGGPSGHEIPDPNNTRVGSAQCHDISERQHAIVRVILDGAVAVQTPVLQPQGPPFTVSVPLTPAAQLLRIVTLAVDPETGAPSPQARSAYDWVDIIGGFQ
eukprot:TRINITY_DN39470_c0_g1_i1.p1 TRINITY_DN39470_c0_g1~~TRINITY_DN39470_c0_g1_i1.p1  ORF type:complete len:594 (+),score=124.14 TRINITY_DN39470_c0_g1_i1:77-1858(+)